MMTRKNNWLLTAVQMGLLAWSGATLAADKVYVANEGADTVSVLDAASFKTLASVRVGKAPHNVQVSPDGKVVWVTNNGSASFPTVFASVRTASRPTSPTSRAERCRSSIPPARRRLRKFLQARGRLKWASRRTGVLSWCRCRRKTRSP